MQHHIVMSSYLIAHVVEFRADFSWNLFSSIGTFFFSWILFRCFRSAFYDVALERFLRFDFQVFEFLVDFGWQLHTKVWKSIL